MARCPLFLNSVSPFLLDGCGITGRSVGRNTSARWGGKYYFCSAIGCYKDAKTTTFYNESWLAKGFHFFLAMKALLFFQVATC
jgi:hypothetical protein